MLLSEEGVTLVFRAGGHPNKTAIVKWDEFKGENPAQTGEEMSKAE